MSTSMSRGSRAGTCRRIIDAADRWAHDHDLVELVDFMMATGLRIGEVSAVTWAALELEAGTVEVRGTGIRVTGRGLWLKPNPSRNPELSSCPGGSWTCS